MASSAGVTGIFDWRSQPTMRELIVRYSHVLEPYLPAWALALMGALNVGLPGPADRPLTREHERVRRVFHWVEKDPDKRLPVALSVLRLLEESTMDVQDQRVDEMLETEP